MHFERQYAFQNAWNFFFPEKKIYKIKKYMCTYPTLNFQTRYLKHTYFFIWPNYRSICLFHYQNLQRISVRRDSLWNKGWSYSRWHIFITLFIDTYMKIWILYGIQDKYIFICLFHNQNQYLCQKRFTQKEGMKSHMITRHMIHWYTSEGPRVVQNSG